MKRLIAVVLMVCMAVCVISCGKPESKRNVDVPVPEFEMPKGKLMNVTLYFPDDNMMYLHPVEKTIDVSDNLYFGTEAVCKKVAEAVIIGPSSDSQYVSPVSGFVRVIDVDFNNVTNICTINLSKEFAENNTGGSTKEIMAIYSLVNSLCEIDGVTSVKINIEGNTNAEFGGHFTLEHPFAKETSYIED